MAACRRHPFGIGVSDTNAPNQEKAHPGILLRLPPNAAGI